MVAINQTAEWIEEVLKSLPMAKWDRLVSFTEGLRVFGWIDRDDSKKDFIVIDLHTQNRKVYLIATSSKIFSEPIARILGHSHTDCVRVEELFPNLQNMIKEAK